MSELYAIVIKETKEILDADSIKEYWNNYGDASSRGLYGWIKPKKIYTKLHLAKTGFSHIPEQMKPHLAIATFTFNDFVVDGNKLKEEQKLRREDKKRKREERNAKYQLELARKEFEDAKLKLEKIKTNK